MTRPRSLTRTELRDFPLPPVGDGDKNDHGRLLIVAGSRQVPGAAILSGTSALRSGAGKVRIATAASVTPALAVEMPELLVIPLEENRTGGFASSATRVLRGESESADAIVAGPGMGRSGANVQIASAILRSGKPVALDAALLHSLATVAESCRSAEVSPILLPHSGEMASLLDVSKEQVERDREAAADQAARRYRATVLMKGSSSIVATPDGRRWAYRGGAPGLGVAGSGDTLAGIVGALLARGAEPLTALLWAVLLHGEAGETLSRRVGPVGFLAREIPGEIPALLAR